MNKREKELKEVKDLYNEVKEADKIVEYQRGRTGGKKDNKVTPIVKPKSKDAREVLDGMDVSMVSPSERYDYAFQISKKLEALSEDANTLSDSDLPIDVIYDSSQSNLPIQSEPTIHDRFRKYILQVSSGYLRDLSYADAMVMLRWMENKTGHTIPINYSCGNCVMDLVKMFSRLEEKK
jgi:hypothetical protein